MSFERNFARLQFSGAKRLSIYEKLAEQVEDDVSLQRALDDLWKRATRNKREAKSPRAMALAEWRSAMRNGRYLGEAIGDWAPEDERMLIQANESGQRVADGLRQAARLIEGKTRMRSALIGGLAYPIILLLCAIGVIFLFGTQVIPQFAMVLPTERWTGAAASMAFLADFVQSYMPFLMILLAGLVVLYFVSVSRWCGKLRSKFDRFPPWSMYRLFAGVGFIQSLAAMTTAREPLPEALQKIAAMSVPWMRERILAAHFHIRQGKNLGEALEMTGHGFPDNEIIDDLVTYSQSGSLDRALSKIAMRWLEKGEQRIKSASKVLFVASLLMMFGLIIWIIAGMYAIQQQVGQMAGMGAM